MNGERSVAWAAAMCVVWMASGRSAQAQVMVEGGTIQTINANMAIAGANLGQVSSNNTLNVTSGAVVNYGGGLHNQGGVVGATNNLMRVVDMSSRLDNVAAFTLGGSGSFNRLVVTNNVLGGIAFINTFVMGDDATAQGNTALLRTRSSLAGGSCIVGDDGSWNRMDLAESFGLNVGSLAIGIGAPAVGNEVFAGTNGTIGGGMGPSTITVGGSGASNRLHLANGTASYTASAAVGANGVGNVVLVEKGGAMQGAPGGATLAAVGQASGASNNVVRIQDPMSRWEEPRQFTLGVAGASNTMVLVDGGAFQSPGGVLTVGQNAGSDNNLVLLRGGVMEMGGGSVDVRRGRLWLEGSGSDAAIGTLTANLGPSSEVTLDRGRLSVMNATVMNGDLFEIGAGLGAVAEFQLRSGMATFGNGLDVQPSSFLTGNGTIVAGGNVTLDGTIAPGDLVTPGLLQFTADPIVPSATGAFGFDLFSGASHDRVDVIPVMSLNDAKLEVFLAGAFVPAFADSFSVLTAAGISGTFQNVTFGQTNWVTTDGKGFFRVRLVGGSTVVLDQFIEEITPVAQFADTAPSATESSGVAVIPVLLNTNVGNEAQVQVSTVSGGSAVAGTHYLATNSVLSFPAGVTSNAFLVPLLNDGLTGSNVTVAVKLTAVTNCVAGAFDDALLTILDETPSGTTAGGTSAGSTTAGTTTAGGTSASGTASGGTTGTTAAGTSAGSTTAGETSAGGTSAGSNTGGGTGCGPCPDLGDQAAGLDWEILIKRPKAKPIKFKAGKKGLGTVKGFVQTRDLDPKTEEVQVQVALVTNFAVAQFGTNACGCRTSSATPVNWQEASKVGKVNKKGKVKFKATKFAADAELESGQEIAVWVRATAPGSNFLTLTSPTGEVQLEIK